MYSELIKNFQSIRSYMRQFYVYGFKSRTEYDAKSARSYDDVRRRIDSWLGKYMFFRQGESGRAQFLSVDARTVVHNPLYRAFQAKTFTDNDILLHFCILDLLADKEWLSFREIVDRLYREYLDAAQTERTLDESTIRNKLKEYVKLGLLEQKKEGKSFLYRCSIDEVDAASWKDAVSFFSESNPLGVVGAFLLDKEGFWQEEVFCYKHHYLLHALDSQILYELLDAMSGHCAVEIKAESRHSGEVHPYWLCPLKIYISAQTGREYLLGYEYGLRKLSFFRLDHITAVKKGQADGQWALYEERHQKMRRRMWGVAAGPQRQIDHVEMTLHIGAEEQFILGRLEREKRNGEIVKVDDTTYRYVTDTHEASEMMPWVRTFIGRIVSFSCSDRRLEKLLRDDLEEMNRMYLGGDDDGIQ